MHESTFSTLIDGYSEIFPLLEVVHGYSVEAGLDMGQYSIKFTTKRGNACEILLRKPTYNEMIVDFKVGGNLARTDISDFAILRGVFDTLMEFIINTPEIKFDTLMFTGFTEPNEHIHVNQNAYKAIIGTINSWLNEHPDINDDLSEALTSCLDACKLSMSRPLSYRTVTFELGKKLNQYPECEALLYDIAVNTSKASINDREKLYINVLSRILKRNINFYRNGACIKTDISSDELRNADIKLRYI